jgi:hypothetical protein
MIRKSLPIPEKEKSSEERSLGALEIEKTSPRIWVADTVERVAKP